MMGLLNNEEIKAPEHLTISENDAFNAGRKAQYQEDIKWFLEWLEQWDEGRSDARIVPASAIESLEQLVEE